MGAALGVLLMALLPTYQLTVYDADDTTPLFAVSTDPGHAAPYLKAFTSFPEQEVDYAKGSASIGQMSVQIVDVAQTPGDQDTGYLTGLLADADGLSQLNGHRAVATQDVGAGAEIVLDGVVRSVRLLDTFATYELELRDIRERERKTKAFERTDTPTIVPRGVLNGFGISVVTPFGTFWSPVRPTLPVPATYQSVSASSGWIIPAGGGVNNPDCLLTAAMRDALESIAPLESDPSTYVFDRWKLLWRAAGSGGAYTELTQVRYAFDEEFRLGNIGVQGNPEHLVTLVVNNDVSGATLPSNGQSIEFIIQYDGPVTEDWNYHLQGLTVGELLRNGYRGDYSVEPPRIRYDETELLKLTTPVRIRLKEPVADFRAWAEKHAYPIAHAAPTLNADGEIAPITYLLPDASVTPVNLGDSNCRPSSAGWAHGSEDAVNLVRVKYRRLYAASASDTQSQQTADTILEREVTIEHRVQDSIDLIGEQTLEIDSELLAVVGGRDGAPLFGDVQDETGAKVAALVSRMATDRFVLGGQYFALEADRSDADVEALQAGAWAIVGVSWAPDYTAGTRGASRLTQVVSRRNIDAAWTALTLIDAGSDNAPLTQPTLGTITVDSAGVVSIPVTALGAGSEARVDYAVSATEPAVGSSLWTFAGRVDQVATVQTPPLAPGATVWVRARGEGLGERPSAWTTAVSEAVGTQARVLSVGLTLDVGGVPTVTWEPNTYALGIRVYFSIHDPADLPTFASSDDFDAADLEATLSALSVGYDRAISVRVEPYTGWTGSAVSGTPGPSVDVTEVRERSLIKAGGIEINAESEQILFGAATAPLVGVGIFLGLDGSDYEFRAGDPGGEYIHWDGSSLTIAGTITAVAGEIGGWTIAPGELSSGSVRLQSTAERILMGAATAPLTGTGIFIGLDGSDYEFRVGNTAAQYIHWDGAVLTLQGAVIQSPGAQSDLSIQGWAQNIPFVATDFNTVSWSAGQIVFPLGNAYNITPGGNTGNMVGPTYIYFDSDVSTSALQVTIDPSDTVGANRILIAAASPNADSTKRAEFIVFGGGVGTRATQTIFANVIAANTITGNEILANTITATHISALSFSGKTAVFDTGSVGGWTLAAQTLSSGNVSIRATDQQIRMGAATAPLTGIGIFIGLDGSDYEFRAGNPAGDFIHWDGTTLTISGTIDADAIIAADSFTAANPIFSGDVLINGTLSVLGAAPTSRGSAYLDSDGASIGRITAAYQDSAGSPVNVGEIRLEGQEDGGRGLVRGFFFSGTPPADDSGFIEFLDVTADPATGDVSLVFSAGGSEIRMFPDVIGIVLDAPETLNIEVGRTRLMYVDAASPTPFPFGTLAKNMATTTLTGTTAETSLRSVTIPGTTMAPSGGVRLTTWGTTAGANANRDFFVDFGTDRVFTRSVTAAQIGRWHLVVEIHNVANNAVQETFAKFVFDDGAVIALLDSAGTQATASDVLLDLRGDLTNAGDSITVDGFLVEYL